MSVAHWISALLSRKNAFDERYVQHRYKSTRFAVLAGTLVMLGMFTYSGATKGVIRWDLFAIMGSMALAKVAAMLHYRLTN